MGERNLWTAAGDAIADVRSKLIDEGWFGRRGPTPAHHDLSAAWSGPDIHDTPRDLAREADFAAAWSPRDEGPPSADATQEIGVDR